MKKLLDKYSALFTLLFILIFNIIFYNFFPFFGLQLLLVLMMGFMSIAMLLTSLSYAKNKTKLIFLGTLLICVLGYFDLVYTEPTYELSDSNVEMIQISDYYVVYVENSKLATINKEELKFDNNNPVKAYKMAKKDRFGTNLFETTVIKSDLMDNYIPLR